MHEAGGPARGNSGRNRDGELHRGSPIGTPAKYKVSGSQLA